MYQKLMRNAVRWLLEKHDRGVMSDELRNLAMRAACLFAFGEKAWHRRDSAE